MLRLCVIFILVLGSPLLAHQPKTVDPRDAQLADKDKAIELLTQQVNALTDERNQLRREMTALRADLLVYLSASRELSRTQIAAIDAARPQKADSKKEK